MTGTSPIAIAPESRSASFPPEEVEPDRAAYRDDLLASRRDAGSNNNKRCGPMSKIHQSGRGLEKIALTLRTVERREGRGRARVWSGRRGGSTGNRPFAPRRGTWEAALSQVAGERSRYWGPRATPLTYAARGERHRSLSGLARAAERAGAAARGLDGRSSGLLFEIDGVEAHAEDGGATPGARRRRRARA